MLWYSLGLRVISSRYFLLESIWLLLQETYLTGFLLGKHVANSIMKLKIAKICKFSTFFLRILRNFFYHYQLEKPIKAISNNLYTPSRENASACDAAFPSEKCEWHTNIFHSDTSYIQNKLTHVKTVHYQSLYENSIQLT